MDTTKIQLSNTQKNDFNTNVKDKLSDSGREIIPPDQPPTNSTQGKDVKPQIQMTPEQRSKHRKILILIILLPAFLGILSVIFSGDHCESTSFLPECDSTGNFLSILFIISFYYYLLPFPLALPTLASVVFSILYKNSIRKSQIIKTPEEITIIQKTKLSLEEKIKIIINDLLILFLPGLIYNIIAPLSLSGCHSVGFIPYCDSIPGTIFVIFRQLLLMYYFFPSLFVLPIALTIAYSAMQFRRIKMRKLEIINNAKKTNPVGQ